MDALTSLLAHYNDDDDKCGEEKIWDEGQTQISICLSINEY